MGLFSLAKVVLKHPQQEKEKVTPHVILNPIRLQSHYLSAYYNFYNAKFLN